MQLTIKHRLALGDTVVLTALCRDIKAIHGDKYSTVVDCHFREVFDRYPYARALKSGDMGDTRGISAAVSYRNGIVAAGRGQRIHMLHWYYIDFRDKTGIDVWPLQAKPHLPLHPDEHAPLVSGKYWLLLAGGKTDVTTKVWRPTRWQALVNDLALRGIKCVQAGSTAHNHFNPKLTGVVDVVGQWPSARKFFNLVAHAEGVICPITSAMHIAAAYDKPCVVIAGGREEPWWEGYVNSTPSTFGDRCVPVTVEHRYLHTLGKLDCCNKKGCWMHRVQPLNDGASFDSPRRRCKLPVFSATEVAPACLDEISVERVTAAVMSYYENGQIIAPDIGDRVMLSVPALPRISLLDVKPSITPLQPGFPEISHPIIDGKLTLCVLCYGDYPELAKKCLGSILSTVPSELVDIRVGLNAVCNSTRDYVKSLPVTKIYDHPENIKKYPLMREMFYDDACPLDTNYLVWFDDDTSVVDAEWCRKLCRAVISHHDAGCRLYGWEMLHDAAAFAKNGHDPVQWLKKGVWWADRPLLCRGQHALVAAPNGTAWKFVTGWHWAIHVPTLFAAGIPDTRLNHNGGDCLIGLQMYQAGGNIFNWNVNKKHIWCPAKEAGGRRGYSDKCFPWAVTVK